jgi:mannosidase alpha-like ER degradation enhancer 2
LLTVAVAAVVMNLAGQAVQPRPALDRAARAALADAVKAEFLHAWNGYKRHAWGHDDLRPVSRSYRDWYRGGVLYMTAVDSLDAMLVMGLDQEAAATKAYLLEHLTFDLDISVKNFEIVIRVLGGLLSAHQMTGDARLLAMADDLGTRLLPAFGSKTGMPYVNVNLKTGAASGAVSNPAEIGTLILEFGTLAKLTGKDVYYTKAKRALTELYDRRSKATGLVGESIDVDSGQWTNTSSHIGGAIDSFYEYLLKCDKLFGDADCARMWRDQVAAVNEYLADERGGALWYGTVDMNTGRRTETEFGSLHAFFPAVLAMGGDVARARRLQESSFRMWTLHHIEPEVLDYAAMRVVSPGYQLRPEIIESAYYLSHHTGDPRYLEMGRTMFEDLKRYCRTPDGYTALRSVVTKEKGDLQHSFFLAETLKYLYLLFAPERLDLDKTVFNTEAHPLRRTW